jgi:hypothetical protein
MGSHAASTASRLRHELQRPRSSGEMVHSSHGERARRGMSSPLRQALGSSRPRVPGEVRPAPSSSFRMLVAARCDPPSCDDVAGKLHASAVALCHRPRHRGCVDAERFAVDARPLCSAGGGRRRQRRR